MKRLEQLKSMLQENPQDHFLQFALAKEFEKMGDIEAAIEHFEKLIAENADYVGAYYHLGKLYEKEQDIESAIETWQKGIVITRKVNDQHAQSELAAALMEYIED